MNDTSIHSEAPRFPWLRWFFASLILLVLGSAAWAFLDWRYVTQLWTPEEMIQANGILAWVLPIGTLFVQYIVLREQTPGRQTLGAMTSAMLVTLAWWMLILTAGEWFHLKIGGVLE